MANTKRNGPLFPRIAASGPLALALLACGEPVIRSEGNDAGHGGADTAGTPLSVASFTAGGSGCPGTDTVSYTLDATSGSIVLSFSQMSIDAPRPGFHHIHCTAGFVVHGAAGRQFAAVGTRARGVAEIPGNADGSQLTTVFFAASPDSRTFRVQLAAGAAGAYAQSSAPLDAAAAQWSPCGSDTIFNVNSALNLTVGAGAARINLSELEVAIAWRAC